MANKYLDSTGVKHLWDKIKTWTNSNFQPIGSGGGSGSFNGGDITNNVNILNDKSLSFYDPFGTKKVEIDAATGARFTNSSVYITEGILSVVGTIYASGITPNDNNMGSVGSPTKRFHYMYATNIVGSDGVEKAISDIALKSDIATSGGSIDKLVNDKDLGFGFNGGGQPSLQLNENRMLGISRAGDNFNSPFTIKFPTAQVDGVTTLVAREELKTINGQSLIGSGDITINGGSALDENGNLVFDDYNQGIVFSANDSEPAIYFDDDDTVRITPLTHFNSNVIVGDLNDTALRISSNNISKWVNETGDDYTYNFPDKSGTIALLNNSGILEFDSYYRGIEFVQGGSSIYENEDDTLVFQSNSKPRWKYYDSEADDFVDKELATMDDVSLPADPYFNDVTIDGRLEIYSDSWEIDNAPNDDDIDAYFYSKGIKLRNHSTNDTNYLYFPEKTGILATLDDIQEGGAKIQILTWEDDD